MQEDGIAIVGVGYVGLPLAIGLAGYHAKVIAYDVDQTRINELKKGVDRNKASNQQSNVPASVEFTAN